MTTSHHHPPGSSGTAAEKNATSFSHVVTSADALVDLVGDADAATRGKVLSRLDHHCRALIECSPLCVIGTFSASGRTDVSPRGGPPGFVEVIDERRLAFAEAKGNKLNDSLRNILETGRIGMLFLIPGMNETLRINGRACATEDPAILGRHVVEPGRSPSIAIGVDVEEAFLQCAKALIRSSLWKTDAWPSLDGIARPAQIWKDHLSIPGLTIDDIEAMQEDAYTNELY